MSKRQSNRPDRRVIPKGSASPKELGSLAERLRYVGSALHKLHPGDYGFVPSHNPRPSKSPCDQIRSILLAEAQELFRLGIQAGMVSPYGEGGNPKYVWVVDGDNDVYEAKTKPERETEYHGYRLGEDDKEMRRYILEEWKKRCP